MNKTADQLFLPHPRQRADGATIACVYVTVLMVIPSGLVVQGIPLSIAPATLTALFLGLCWFCAHLSLSLGMAKGRNPVRTILFIFTMSLFATYAYGNYVYLSPDEVNQADRTMVILLAIIGMALLVCDGITSRDRVDVVLRTLVVTAAIVTFIGALQFVADVDLTRYMVLPGLKFTAAADASVIERSGFRRVSGTTGNPIEFGVLSAMLLPIALHYGLQAKSVGARVWPWHLCSALIASGLLFSVSRSAVLGIFAAGLVLLLGWPKRKKIHAILVAAAFLVVAKIVFPGLLSTFFGLFQNLSSDDSVSYRTQRYPIAAQQIASHFWLGRGVGTWYFPKHFALDNQYIMTLIESGVVGFAVLIGLFLTTIVTAVRAFLRSADPLNRDLALTLMASAVVPVVGSVTFDLLSFRTLEGVLFLVVGVTGALLRLTPPRVQGLPRQPAAATTDLAHA